MTCQRCGTDFAQVDQYALCLECWQKAMQPMLSPREERVDLYRPKEKRITYERAVAQSGKCPARLKPFHKGE